MEFTEVGLLAILAAAAAGYAFGALYYTVLSRPWLAAVGLAEEQRSRGRSPLPFLVAALAQLIMAAVLAWFLGHGAGGPAEPERLAIYDGLRIGFLAWLGFTITTLAVNHGFQGARRALTAIDGIHWLAVLLIQGALLALIGG